MTVYPIVDLILHLTSLTPTFSPWELCALNIISNSIPTSISFIYRSPADVPLDNIYRILQVPSQTLFGHKVHELPILYHGALVFVVDDDLVWTDEAVEKYRLGGQNGFRVMIVANGKDPERDFHLMKDLFSAMWLSGIVKSAVMLVNDTSSKIYTYIPFGNSSSCEDTTPVLLGECSEVADKVFDLTYKVDNLNHCPIRVAVFDSRPFFNFPLTGRMSPLIRELVKRMNARVEPVAPVSGVGGGSCGEGERVGVRGMVFNGTAHMAIGNFNHRECATLAYVGMGYTQCQTWCTPVLAANDYVFLFLLRQLQPGVWLALIMTVLLVSVSVVVLSTVSHEPWTSSDVFNLAVAIYASPPPTNPRATPLRAVVVAWLWACLVLRTVYEAEMKSQSAVQLDTRILRTLEELIDEDLLLCTALANVQMLRSVDNPLIQRVSRKTKVCNGSLYNNIKVAARQKDRAIMGPDSYCLVTGSEMGKEGGALYHNTGGCFKNLGVALIITLPGSPFNRKWRVLQNRCVQAGLITKWLDARLPAKEQSVVRPLSMRNLLPALFALSVGCLGGSILFIAEKTFYKWSRTLKP